MKTKNNDVGLLVQFILSFWIVVFVLISIFEKTFFNGMEAVLALTLLVMAYNNQKTYKRKYASIIYTICAILILMSLVIKL